MEDIIQAIWTHMSVRQRLNLLDKWVKSDYKVVFRALPGGKRGPNIYTISFGKFDKSRLVASILDARKPHPPVWATKFLTKQITKIIGV